MSYIINETDPFVSIKLTEKGREKLAKGALNFSFWGVGDSEINYDREEIVDANPTDTVLSGVSKIFRPFDRQPNIKSFITKDDGVALQTMTAANIKTIKAVVNNEADMRGFFSGTQDGWTTLTGDTYIENTGTLDNAVLSGGTTLELGVTGSSVGDYVLLKMSNNTLGALALDSNSEPIPHLWYRIEAAAGTSVTVDRALPNNVFGTGSSTSQWIIYGGGEVKDEFSPSASTTSYWDTGTLSFASCCDISCDDVPVWNMNNAWCEDLAGITGTVYENHTQFGSYQYLGTKHPYYDYECSGDGVNSTIKCDGISEFDGTPKTLSIIHYTNNTVSNFYGEFLHINTSEDKVVKLHLPDLMYNRRSFSGGTGSGDTMGMTFLSSGGTKTQSGTNIKYMDLIEDPTLVDGTPRTVGRVFPDTKTMVIHDEEVVAATSYKSNRNWTLPALTSTLTAPNGSTGVLAQNSTMYMTYILENSSGTGLTTTLPCQRYAKITNQTATARDVEFKLEDVGLLPYMRKTEKAGYDGRGFHATDFKLVYQIVADADDRPDPAAWKVADFTSSAFTTTVGETIDPELLENQNPTVNGFLMDNAANTGATTFDITVPLSMSLKTAPTELNFGDEKFFYGNIETYIGATIYKTLFDIRINGSEFNTTSNSTRSKDDATNPPEIRATELGIYDSDNDLVIIGKLSKPVKLLAGNTVMFEMALDF
jgi:hypothetical protein